MFDKGVNSYTVHCTVYIPISVCISFALRILCFCATIINYLLITIFALQLISGMQMTKTICS